MLTEWQWNTRALGVGVQRLNNIKMKSLADLCKQSLDRVKLPSVLEVCREFLERERLLSTQGSNPYSERQKQAVSASSTGSSLHEDLALSSSSSVDDDQEGYADLNRRMFESDMESMAESLEAIEPPPVVFEGRARSFIMKRTPRHPCSKPRFPPRSNFLMDLEPQPPKPLKRPAEVTKKSPKKNKVIDAEAEARRNELLRRKKEEREEARRKREEVEARRNEVIKGKKEEREEAERKRAEALARTKEAERSAAREREKKEKLMRERKRKLKESEAEESQSECASTSSTGANSIELRDGRIMIDLSAKDFGDKIVKDLLKKQERDKAQSSPNPIQKAKGIGIRVENLQGKNVKHWCPVSRVICTNIKTHLNNPPAACRGAHAGVDEQKVYDYDCAAIYSRGLRGPVDTTEITEDLVALEGDKEKVKNYVDNLLSAFGVGVKKNDSTSFVPIYDMEEVFKKNKGPENDLQLEIENQADMMLQEEGE
ncbi:Reticulocyte-binding protein 2-like protein a [Frankliniella fusca]|uniref:Reticulocyte-binding protein 2-like protein a n=1 Tax=Frankliniella fusca TaxID=407009 RepID=A0AAE1LFT4_9NEOP|nr:Reticulocyte-binding protein 2-like protein a [Frankliniella fusca]